tara:strand:- start:903 stop:1181 length:279 start_codon:yes stop_codon:yes gene_type:complete
MPMSKKELDALEERSKLKRKLTFPEKVDLLNDEELKNFHQNVIRRLKEIAVREEIDRDELNRLIDNLTTIEKVLRHRRLKAEEEARWLSRLP